MAASSTRLMTFAEFDELPEPEAARLELRHGELVTVSPPKHKHYRVQRRLRKLLENTAADAGVVEIEMAFRARPEYEYRIADVAFLTNERWNRIAATGHLQGAPELVIEVLSPSNTVSEINDKKALCLENGAREFWTVDIEHAQVDVATTDGRSVTFGAGQDVPLFFAPGAVLAVDHIFG